MILNIEYYIEIEEKYVLYNKMGSFMYFLYNKMCTCYTELKI